MGPDELGVGQPCQRPSLLTRKVTHPPGGNRGRGQPTASHLLVQLLLLGLELGLQIRLTGLPHLLEGHLLEVRLGRSLLGGSASGWRTRRGRPGHTVGYVRCGSHLLFHASQLGLHLHRLWRGRTGLPRRLHLGEGLLTRGRSRLHLLGRLGLPGLLLERLGRSRRSRLEGCHPRSHRACSATHPLGHPRSLRRWTRLARWRSPHPGVPGILHHPLALFFRHQAASH